MYFGVHIVYFGLRYAKFPAYSKKSFTRLNSINIKVYAIDGFYGQGAILRHCVYTEKANKQCDTIIISNSNEMERIEKKERNIFPAISCTTRLFIAGFPYYSTALIIN
jgi:hypothetical protein